MLGYCVLPLAVAMVVCRVILLAEQTTLLFFVRLIIVVIGFGWATFGKIVL